MPEDMPGEEQRTMLSFTEAADRLVKDGIAQSMTAEGLRRLARDPQSGWPIGPDDYRVVGKTRTLPYELLVPYIQARKPARGPAKQPRKKRTSPPEQQGDPVTTTTARDRLVETLKSPGLVGLDAEEAAELVNAYRAAVIAEVAEALNAKGAELSELAEEKMQPSIEERAQTWYEAAAAAEKLKLAPKEASDA